MGSSRPATTARPSSAGWKDACAPPSVLNKCSSPKTHSRLKCPNSPFWNNLPFGTEPPRMLNKAHGGEAPSPRMGSVSSKIQPPALRPGFLNTQHTREGQPDGSHNLLSLGLPWRAHAANSVATSRGPHPALRLTKQLPQGTAGAELRTPTTATNLVRGRSLATAYQSTLVGKSPQVTSKFSLSGAKVG